MIQVVQVVSVDNMHSDKKGGKLALIESLCRDFNTCILGCFKGDTLSKIKIAMPVQSPPGHI